MTLVAVTQAGTQVTGCFTSSQQRRLSGAQQILQRMSRVSVTHSRLSLAGKAPAIYINLSGYYDSELLLVMHRSHEMMPTAQTIKNVNHHSQVKSSHIKKKKQVKTNGNIFVSECSTCWCCFVKNWILLDWVKCVLWKTHMVNNGVNLI